MKTEISYERFDGCYGEVTGRCRSGAYLTLDNGQEAFAFKFANLFPGTKVLCTVLKMPVDDRLMLVSIDSVVDYGTVAAGEMKKTSWRDLRSICRLLSAGESGGEKRQNRQGRKSSQEDRMARTPSEVSGPLWGISVWIGLNLSHFAQKSVEFKGDHRAVSIEEQYHTGTFTTYYGRALAVVRVGEKGTMRVTVSVSREEITRVEIQNGGFGNRGTFSRVKRKSLPPVRGQALPHVRPLWEWGRRERDPDRLPLKFTGGQQKAQTLLQNVWAFCRKRGSKGNELFFDSYDTAELLRNPPGSVTKELNL